MRRLPLRGGNQGPGGTSGLVNGLLALQPRPQRYLEIGVASGKTFTAIKADYLVEVDPFPDDFVLPAGSNLHRVPWHSADDEPATSGAVRSLGG